MGRGAVSTTSGGAQECKSCWHPWSPLSVVPSVPDPLHSCCALPLLPTPLHLRTSGSFLCGHVQRQGQAAPLPRHPRLRLLLEDVKWHFGPFLGGFWWLLPGQFYTSPVLQQSFTAGALGELIVQSAR